MTDYSLLRKARQRTTLPPPAAGVFRRGKQHEPRAMRSYFRVWLTSCVRWQFSA